MLQQTLESFVIRRIFKKASLGLQSTLITNDMLTVPAQVVPWKQMSVETVLYLNMEICAEPRIPGAKDQPL